MSEKQKSKFARAFDITLSVIIALLVVLIVVLLFVATPMTVSGDSMYPSLHDGDKVVVLKVGASIERGDIVVFERPGGSEPPVKRVIGMPGDVIRFDSAQRAYFVIPDLGAVHTGLKRVDAILQRLKTGKFAVTHDYCEALSLATVAHIILKEVDEG